MRQFRLAVWTVGGFAVVSVLVAVHRGALPGGLSESALGAGLLACALSVALLAGAGPRTEGATLGGLWAGLLGLGLLAWPASGSGLFRGALLGASVTLLGLSPRLLLRAYGRARAPAAERLQKEARRDGGRGL